MHRIVTDQEAELKVLKFNEDGTVFRAYDLFRLVAIRGSAKEVT